MHIGCHQNSGFPEVGENRLLFEKVPERHQVADLAQLGEGWPYIPESQHGKTRAELARLRKETEAEKARLKAEAEANKEKLAALLITLRDQVEKKGWKKVKKTAQEILEIDPENEEALKALSQAEAELAKLTKKPKKGPGGVKGALDQTKRRVERELFGKEKLKKYVDQVSESIEKMDPDSLHKFIEAHKIYDNYRNWNKELCEFLGFKGEKGADLSADEQMKYVAALQIYLADHFFQSDRKDIFQARRGRKANPFIYIDGKLGGYTMSVLAEYWNSKYPKKKMGALAHSQLSDRLTKRTSVKKTFDSALDHLSRQLGKGPVEVAEGPLVLHEKFEDYFKFYPLLLKQYYTQKEIDGLKMSSDSFKREFNKIVPVLIKNVETKFKDKEALIKVLEKSGADLTLLLPDYKELEKAVIAPAPPVRKKGTPRRRAKTYPKLSVTPEQLDKAKKKPQTKAMIHQLVGRRTERAKKKIQSGYEGQLDAFSAFKKFDIRDMDSFEGIRKGSKLETAYKAFLAVANPLMKLKSRAIRNPEAEKEMEAKYKVALKNLERAAGKYYSEEWKILSALEAEFTQQIARVNLVIEAPNIGSQYRNILGSKALYESYHGQLVSNYINSHLDDVAPRIITSDFLSKPYKIAQFLEKNLDNSGVRTFTSFEDLSGHFRKEALDMLSQVFPKVTSRNDILAVMNSLVKMANLYRLRDAGLSRENYEARLREEYVKVDSVKVKASGPPVASLERPPR